ncbi:MAG: zinc-binding dehydrogenase [Bryobacteraceae bacterium]
MRAWQAIEGGGLQLRDLPMPEPAPGGVVVNMQAVPMLSYLRKVLDGSLGYDTPQRPLTPGTNGIGVIKAVGQGVFHLQPGQRVVIDPHLVANERSAEPAQILIGLTAMRTSHSDQADARAKALQAAWPNGTLAEVVHMPAAVLTPLPVALDAEPAERLAAIAKFAVPYGGFLRAGLQAGETVVVNGATGYFGSAGAMLALALGAARVVAAGRSRVALQELAAAAGPRFVPVVLSGNPVEDAAALRDAAGSGADMALDMVGRADSADSTLAALRSLRRGGRLVLMGSVRQPLPLVVGEMLGNDWRVMGCFMYPPDVPARLVALVAAGLLDLSKIRVRGFPLDQVEPAMDAAAATRGLDLTVVTMG